MKRVFKQVVLILFGITIIFNLSCTKGNDKKSNYKIKRNTKLTIYSTSRFHESGLDKAILPEFEKEYNCKVEVVPFISSSALMNNIRRDGDSGRIDLVMGLDNSFCVSEDDYNQFANDHSIDTGKINHEYLFDQGKHLIPYGFGYLSIVYNEALIGEAPQSFGELQDSRFLNQLVVCDPYLSGIGRATLFWSVALFGNDGYEQFWKSIKKNIASVKPSWQEALDSLIKGECGMIVGFTGTSAWLEDSDKTELPIKYSNMKEGSYLYIEAAGIHKNSKNKGLAEAFIKYIISAEKQQLVVNKLGLFPVNSTTFLPMHFASVPFSSYSVNDRLNKATITSNLKNWLEFWDRLFSFHFVQTFNSNIKKHRC